MDGHGKHRLRVHSPADMLWAVRRHWRGAFLAFGVTAALSIVAYLRLPYS